ncbi:MAG: hypothetical protein ACYDAG_03810 [Chloroflexota bacterium]
MKYQRGESFLTDYVQLSQREQELFKAAVGKLNEAYAQRTGWPPAWPNTLRIKSVASHPNVWELTWSFSGPDGRATFEFVEVDGEPAVKWRRIGGHNIFSRP